MEILTAIEGYSIDLGDQVIIDDEPVEVKSIDDQGDIIYVKGYSYTTGDLEQYEVLPDSEYNLWSA